MHDNAALVVARHAQRVFDGAHVVSVHGSDIAQPKGFEKRVAQPDRLDGLLQLVVQSAQEREVHPVAGTFRRRLHAIVAHTRQQTPEKTGERAHVLRDRHGVVVYHEYDLPLERGAGIQGFQRLAIGQGCVADDRHDVAVGGIQVARGGQTDGGGQRIARMARDECVARGFFRIAEAGKPAKGAKRIKCRPPTREHLPGVCLMADIPHDAIPRRIEHAQQAYRKFHRAERTREMSACLRHSGQHLFAQGGGQRQKLVGRQRLDIGGRSDGVEPHAHATPPIRRSRRAYEAMARSNSTRSKSGHSTSVT